MPKKQSYSIEKLSQDNIGDLVDLYEASFGKLTTKSFLEKKFNTAFTGFKNVGFIAYSEDNEAAAFYGVLPCFCLVNGHKVLVAQSGHTMTHPKHRRAKLFLRLAEKTFEFCKTNGFKAVFGFPNIYSYASFIKKLDWVHFDDYHTFLPKTGSLPWIRIKKTFPFLKGLHKGIKNRKLRKLKNASRIDNSISSRHPHIVHDKDFFTFKSFQDSYLKQIGKCKVWFKTTDMSLMVGDWDCSYNFKLGHQQVTKLAKQLGIPHIRYQVSSNTELFQFCVENNFQKGNTYPIAGIALENSFPLEKMKFTLADFDTF